MNEVKHLKKKTPKVFLDFFFMCFQNIIYIFLLYPTFICENCAPFSAVILMPSKREMLCFIFSLKVVFVFYV